MWLGQEIRRVSKLGWQNRITPNLEEEDDKSSLTFPCKEYGFGFENRKVILVWKSRKQYNVDTPLCNALIQSSDDRTKEH